MSKSMIKAPSGYDINRRLRMRAHINELIPLLDLSTSLDANLNRSLVMTVLPGVMCVGGVLFLHLSIMGAIILYYSSLAASLSNAMWPLIRRSIRH